MTAEIHPGAIASLLSGDHGAPFLLLGPHPAGEGTLSIRAFRPDAAALTVVIDQTGARHPMARLDAGGFFAVTLPDAEFVTRLERVRQAMRGARWPAGRT